MASYCQTVKRELMLYEQLENDDA